MSILDRVGFNGPGTVRRWLLACALLTSGIICSSSESAYWLVVIPGLVVFTAVAVPTERIFAIIVALNLPYAVAAYVAALENVVYYPRLSVNEYWVATRQQLSGLSILLAVSLASGLGKHFGAAVRESAVNLSPRPGIPQYLCVAFAMIVGMHDLSILLRNRGSLFLGGRHTVSQGYWFLHGSMGLVIGIVVTVALVFGSFDPKTRKSSVTSVIVLWMPSILVGERNYAVLCLVVAGLIYLFREKNFRRRRYVIGIAVAGIVGLVLLPTLWSENPMVAANEWILPNSIWVPLATGFSDVASYGATPWISQWPLLLPSSLRPWGVFTVADSFNSRGYVNVGVAANVWADVYPGNLWGGIMAFVGVSVFFMMLSLLFRRIGGSAAPLVCVGVMATWSRWGSWGAIFVLVYATAALLLLLSTGPVRSNDYSAHSRWWISRG